ncbi:NAD(P)H-dependent oxidoreductase subunit E [Mycoplasmatota bacterium zrk1]
MSNKIKVNLNSSHFQELDSFIDGLETTEGELISILHKAQSIFGYLPKEVQIHIAKRVNVPVSRVYGVVSFYSYFTMKPKGKYHISVCTGTACFVRGADAVLRDFEEELEIKSGETTKDGLFSLDSLRCVGACALAPVVLINEDVYGKEDAKKVKEIIQKYMKTNSEG